MTSHQRLRCPPRPSSGIVGHPAPCDRRVRSGAPSLGRRASPQRFSSGRTHTTKPASALLIPALSLPTAELPPSARRQAPRRGAMTPQTQTHRGRRPPVPNRGRTRRESAQQRPRHDHALNLIRAFIDLGDRGRTACPERRRGQGPAGRDAVGLCPSLDPDA
jgi:hypothetical protein